MLIETTDDYRVQVKNFGLATAGERGVSHLDIEPEGFEHLFQTSWSVEVHQASAESLAVDASGGEHLQQIA